MNLTIGNVQGVCVCVCVCGVGVCVKGEGVSLKADKS